MIGGILVMGGLGMVVGIGLALAAKIFYVYVDPKIEAVEESLPGANCGGCGLPGCSANAVAIVDGTAAPSSCVAGGPELAEEIAGIMGVTLEAKEPDFAKPGCTYGYQDADLKYLYRGINDCRAASILSGGTKICPIGCLGLGTCVKECPFDALSIGPDNLPVVDMDKCTGCGTCERVCPKHIITLTSNSRRMLAEYTIDDCTAPCQRNCPAGINIPAYIREITNGNYLEAVKVIKETNPFPAVCGRICVHPCEYECRRNLVDEPVAINYLKRFASDYERISGKRVQVPRAPETGKSMAIIGGGAEGFTAAYYLNRFGHEATVFEATSRFGGLLRKGLPENRLPREILDYEIDGIMDAGVKGQVNKVLGKDITVNSLLKDGFSAVLIAIGGWDTFLSQKNGNVSEGAPLPGHRLLIEFMMSLRAGEKLNTGKHVMIIGGGRASIEAAMACKNEGTEDVHILFRKSSENTPFKEDDIKAAEEAGVQFHFMSALTKLIGEDETLTHVEIATMPDTIPEGGTGEKEVIPVDTLLTGAGRFPELIFVPQSGEEDEKDANKTPDHINWESLFPYPSPFAKEDIGIFRPGEVTGDYQAIVEAIGAGRRVANTVQRFLTNEPVDAPENMIRNTTEVLNLKQLEPITILPRQKMPERPEEELITNPDAEIAIGFTDNEAVTEAKRCLQCGLICYRRVEGKLH